MKNKIIAIVILIIVLIAAIYLDRTFNKNKESVTKTETEETEPIQTLEVKHQYKEGEHVFVGTVQIPSPCHSFNAFIENPEEEGTKYLKIEINDPAEGEICAQVITDRTFKVVYPGPEDTEFKSYINDEEFRLNLFEIPAHIDIEQYELYIKG